MDPNQAAADWQRANQFRPQMTQMFVAASQPLSTISAGTAIHQPAAAVHQPAMLHQLAGAVQQPVVAPATAHVNPKKLQAQSQYFKCPEWASVPRRGVFLEVCKGPDVIDHLNVDGEPYYLFGRAPAADFQLEHPSISRVHFALVHHRDGGIYVIDLGSGHGTLINGRRLEKNKPTKLEENAKLVAGASQRTYTLRRASSANQLRPAEQAQRQAVVPADRKRAREEGSKDDGILSGWDEPVKKQPKQKQHPEVIRCSHILLKHRDMKKPFDRNGQVVVRSKEEAFRLLRAHKDEIILNLDGLGPEAKLRKIAKKESDCPSWKKGGDLGVIKKGQIAKDFEAVAFNLQMGEVGGPVDTELGVHLILRTELRE